MVLNWTVSRGTVSVGVGVSRPPAVQRGEKRSAVIGRETKPPQQTRATFVRLSAPLVTQQVAFQTRQRHNTVTATVAVAVNYLLFVVHFRFLFSRRSKVSAAKMMRTKTHEEGADCDDLERWADEEDDDDEGEE